MCFHRMRQAGTFLIFLTLIPAAPARPDQADAGLPVRLNRLSDRVVVAWVGDFAQGNQMIAVASKKGIVLIDTYASRAQQQLIRTAIEKEFGRRDFFCVVNTHQHYDHTNGNPLYADLPIIAHAAAREGMRSDAQKIPAWIARVNRGIQGMEEKQKTLDFETVEGKTNRENIAYWRTVIWDMENGHVPTYPNITFNDRLSVDLGDLTLELFSFPGLHTKGDILAYIPEERLLCVGDMIADGWLPPLNKDIAPDPAALLQTWQEVINRGANIQYVLTGHSYVKVSFDTFKWRYGYFKTLWEGLKKAREAGKGLAEVQALLAFETMFPDSKDIKRTLPSRTGGKAIDVHAQNVEVLWSAFQK